MPNVGPLELAIVLIIALIVFGPKRLPELGRSLGRGLREFKGSVTGENDAEPPSPPELEKQAEGDSADLEKKKTDDEPVVHDRG